MKFIYTLSFLCLTILTASAQYRYENFNNGLPDTWATTSKVPLTLSSEHYKDGNQSLKWQPKNNDAIIVTPLAIPKAETIGHLASEIFIYSKEVSADTLIFQFLDKAGKLQRQGKMLLNYAGWREYHRSLEFDYEKGANQEPFELDGCRIVYKSAKNGGGKTIYFDAVRFTGDKDVRRQAAPHTQIDEHQFKRIGLAGGNPLESWLNKPSKKLVKVSESEAKDIKKLRGIYISPLATVKNEQLKEAMAYVRYSNITRNNDGSIKGRGILAIAKPDTLVKISGYCGVLARSFLLNKNKEAHEALLLFTEYLLDQGLAEGGRNVLPTNSYLNARNFPLGFIDALDAYPPDLRSQVLAMLKWSHEYNQIYADELISSVNTDFIHLKLDILFKLALKNPTEEEVLRDLQYLSRFLEQCVHISEGGSDGIKPDGIGFHHHSAHMSYMSAYGTWIERAYSLKGTSFKISKLAYNNMRLAIKTLLLQTSAGKIMPHSLTGRKPFASGVPVKSGSLAKLIEIGDDLNMKDDDLKAFFNYMYRENKYPAKADFDGFYQFNYAQLGVLRKDNWIAAMRGFTERMFGAEIYDKQNRFGRYQSYGSLEILYNGNHAESGYIISGKGWDWNVIPGTTTVHLPWDKLRAVGATSTEFQDRSLAGALSLGKNGVFGLDFQQNLESRYENQALTFRKSVFAFDNILVCLGSNINAKTTGASHVATNLFQNISKEGNLPINIEGKKISEDSYITELSLDNNAAWIINNVNTGYYIPKGNGTVQIVRDEQITPDYTSNDGKKTNRANASKAWIGHGANPKGLKYTFVVVPQTSTKEMNLLSKQIEDNKIYNILRQTDALHAVKYIPGNLTAYTFFEPQSKVDIGYVKSISGKALLGIEEKGDLLVVTIANPDLNTKPAPKWHWISTENKVKLQLSGNWKVVENDTKALIGNTENLFEVTFNLVHGFSNKIVLKKQ